MYVCLCHPLSDRKLRQLAATGEVRTVRDVAERTCAGTSCGSCVAQIRQIVDEECKARCAPERLAAK